MKENISQLPRGEADFAIGITGIRPWRPTAKDTSNEEVHYGKSLRPKSKSSYLSELSQKIFGPNKDHQIKPTIQ